MLAVLTVFIVAVFSLLITRIATLALVLTGMSYEAARFQARSALTGTGFTTIEAEAVVAHPVRRRIVMTLMMVGGAGLVTAIATLIIGFANASRAEAFERLLILGAALGLLLLISRTRWFNRALTPILSRALSRYTQFESQDYAELLRLGGEWGVGEVAVREGDWLACERIVDLDLRSEGIAVLGIEREDGSYFGAPPFDRSINPGDILLLYGRRARLTELDDRPEGPEGDAAHQDAVAAEQREAHSEQVEDASRERQVVQASEADDGNGRAPELRGGDEQATRHWEQIYSTNDPGQLSWQQTSPATSLELIEAAGLPVDAPIIDLGGGTSGLAAELLAAGYQDVTVADISSTALEDVREQMERVAASQTQWLQLDVRADELERSYALWHDRAVFHFMVEAAEREAYLENLRRGLRAGGHLVLATFGPEGPTSCSGLPVRRYGVEELQRVLGPDFRLRSSRTEDHKTPGGASQQFLYVHLERSGVR